MKMYHVTLRAKPDALVRAKSYQKDGLYYVFTTEDDETEVQFFLISEVIGISVAQSEEDATGCG